MPLMISRIQILERVYIYIDIVQIKGWDVETESEATRNWIAYIESTSSIILHCTETKI